MKLKDKTYSNISLLSIGNLANALLGFVFLSGVAKVLSLPDFGKYALLTSLLTLISKILDFGTNSQFVAAHKDGEYFNKTSANFIDTKILLFLISLPIAYITLTIMEISEIDLIALFIIGLAAYGVNYTIYAFYQKSQKYFQIIALNGLPAIIKGLFGVLLLTHMLSINITSAFAIFSLSILASITIWLISPLSEYSLNASDKINLRENFNSILASFSAGISQLIYESWQTINNMLVKIFNSFTDIGIFSMANKISNIFTLISLSIFTVLLPRNTQRKNSGSDRYNFGELAILSLGVIAFSLLLIIVAQSFMRFVFQDKFNESIKYLDVLIIAGAISAIQNFVESYFYVENKTHFLLIVNSFKLCILIGGALITIPLFGLYSLAFLNLASAVCGLMMLLYFVIKHEQFIKAAE